MFGRRTQTKKILELIKSRGLSQTWLAHQIGYSREYFNDVIHNRNSAKLNPYKVVPLARLLGVPAKDILRLFGLPKKPILIVVEGKNESPFGR